MTFRGQIVPQTMSRDTFLTILKTAYDIKSYRFGRQSAINWLTIYPGDLEVQYWLAQILLLEGKSLQALPILEKICKQDPEFGEAHLALSKIEEGRTNLQKQIALGCAYSIGILEDQIENLPVWSPFLLRGRLALKAGLYDEAEQLIHQVIGMNLDVPLPAIYHLALSQARGQENSVYQLAMIYHQRWPECLQFSLSLADAKIQQSDEKDSVELLHQCVSNDSNGQVAKRLWGKDHRYQLIWPAPLEIDFGLSIPADVSGRLGWNRLSPGGELILDPNLKAVEQEEDVLSSENKVVEEKDSESALALDATEAIQTPPPQESEKPHQPVQETHMGTNEQNEAERSPNVPSRQPRHQPIRVVNDDLRSAEQAFLRLANQLHTPEIGKSDGRFPVYVIYSSHLGLVRQYGLQTTLVVEREMKFLADAVQMKRGWGSLVFLPDDLQSTSRIGLQKLDVIDPWKLKLALVDLDKSLAKKGSMIGAVLIVGGPEVVPFHKLPNPTDDSDEAIISDNPYGSLDSNYFAPEWPVGRLPGEAGPDAGLLLEQLRRLTRYHTETNRSEVWWRRLLYYFNVWQQMQQLRQKITKGKIYSSFGYSAAAWMRSSLSVFKPVGEQQAMLVSPPVVSGKFEPRRITDASVGYYNLHGLPDAVEWYGQREANDRSSNIDYPVALGPRDLVKNGRAPQVVFSEACYGGYIDGKSEDNALALRFTSIGTMAVIGSTSIAYGSVATPLIGADLLGQLFWKNLRQGLTVGDAFWQAKLELVKEMNRRQGFLDGEDQKTLISFILYGDPLMRCSISQVKSKALPRKRIHLSIKTICDRQVGGGELEGVSVETIREVKRSVEKYLPGLDDAEFIISREHETCNSTYHRCPTGELGSRAGKFTSPGRIVVTIQKKVQSSHYVHMHYARATLDTTGKVVKLAISR